MLGAFEELFVWRRAMDLMVEVYELTARLPRHEAGGFISQMRRAAASIPANIAEGNARPHRREYLHFLAIARGSVAELVTHLEGTRRLGYLSRTELARALQLATSVGQMLTRLVASLSV